MADNRWNEDDYRRDDDLRGWTERAGDEVRSWFGDDGARMRRGNDERGERYPYGGARSWRDQGDGNRERASGARDLGGYEGSRSGWSESERGYGDSGRSAGSWSRTSQSYGRASQAYPRHEWDHGYGREDGPQYGRSGQYGWSTYDRAQLRRTYSDWTPGAASGARDWEAREPDRGWGTRTGAEWGESSRWGRESFAGRGPKGYRRSDERIREEVSDALTADPLVDASEISVQVESGTVTLTGTVIAREQKRRAEDVTERVSGVDDVTNQLRVMKQDYTQPNERQDVSRMVTPSVVTPEGRAR